jgi:hypothetical protein
MGSVRKPGRQPTGSQPSYPAPWWTEPGEGDDELYQMFRRATPRHSGPWKWLVSIGFLAAIVLGLGFAVLEGLLPGLGLREGVAASWGAQARAGSESADGNKVVARERWSVALAGNKIAAPMNLDSRGSLSGVVVAITGTLPAHF